MLTPVEHSLKVAMLDEMCLGIHSLQNELVISEVLDLVLERLVLFEDVSDV